jgi:CheY-like chemotaxis protein
VINSEPGKGTLIGSTCRCWTMPEHAATPAQPAERVLIVEDEPELLALSASLFRSIGYDVLCASNGADARLIIERDPAAVHVLFTDVVMPGISGLELAEWAARTHPEIRHGADLRLRAAGNRQRPGAHGPVCIRAQAISARRPGARASRTAPR